MRHRGLERGPGFFVFSGRRNYFQEMKENFHIGLYIYKSLLYNNLVVEKRAH